jgi:hypothetical protein
MLWNIFWIASIVPCNNLFLLLFDVIYSPFFLDVEVCGLENLGRNWCYSNGLLQAMASCPVLCRWIEHLLRVSSSSEGQISSSWCSSLPRQDADGLFLLPARPCYGAFGHKMPLLAQLDVVIRGEISSLAIVESPLISILVVNSLFFYIGLSWLPIDFSLNDPSNILSEHFICNSITPNCSFMFKVNKCSMTTDDLDAIKLK